MEEKLDTSDAAKEMVVAAVAAENTGNCAPSLKRSRGRPGGRKGSRRCCRLSLG
jgi:hypothetical protein